jgi:hypothetical protein
MSRCSCREVTSEPIGDGYDSLAGGMSFRCGILYRERITALRAVVEAS